MMLSTPEASASSTPYWMMGVSTRGSISFGCAFVAGRNLVPRPAAGNTALRIVLLIDHRSPGGNCRRSHVHVAFCTLHVALCTLHSARLLPGTLALWHFATCHVARCTCSHRTP